MRHVHGRYCKILWRKLDQKARFFFELLEKTTTTVEYKYLNRSKLRYTNTKMCAEVKKMVFEEEEWEEGEDEEWEEEEW
jgi:hypothetical protein